MIDPYDTKPDELGFSWVDNNGKYHCWMTERMERYAARHMDPAIVSIDYEHALWVMQHNGLEKHRLLRLTPQVIAQKPIINIEMPDGTYKIVDGSHRYVRAAMLGWKEIPSYLFPIALADDFKVDIPDDMNEACKRHIPTFSGIV